MTSMIISVNGWMPDVDKFESKSLEDSEIRGSQHFFGVTSRNSTRELS